MLKYIASKRTDAAGKRTDAAGKRTDAATSGCKKKVVTRHVVAAQPAVGTTAADSPPPIPDMFKAGAKKMPLKYVYDYDDQLV
jgi:hypothetical protein